MFVKKDVLEKVLNERTVLVVKMGQRLEPVVDSMSQELLLKSNERFGFTKEMIEASGYEVREIVLEAEEINRLIELLDDYYSKKIDAIAAYAEILKDYIREDDADFLLNVDPVSAGAFLVEDEEGIYIETDINAFSDEEDLGTELSEEDLKDLSSEELLRLMETLSDDDEEDYYDECYEDDEYDYEDDEDYEDDFYEDDFYEADEFYEDEDFENDTVTAADLRNDVLRETLKNIYRS